MGSALLRAEAGAGALRPATAHGHRHKPHSSSVSHTSNEQTIVCAPGRPAGAVTGTDNNNGRVSHALIGHMGKQPVAPKHRSLRACTLSIHG